MSKPIKKTGIVTLKEEYLKFVEQWNRLHKISKAPSLSSYMAYYRIK